jgi:hypothetical protein
MPKYIARVVPSDPAIHHLSCDFVSRPGVEYCFTEAAALS